MSNSVKTKNDFAVLGEETTAHVEHTTDARTNKGKNIGQRRDGEDSDDDAIENVYDETTSFIKDDPPINSSMGASTPKTNVSNV